MDAQVSNPNFLPILNWADADVGDIGFYAGTSLLSDLIEECQPGIGADGSWTPSHAFIVRDCFTVVEANANGMCQVAPAEEYQAALPSGRACLFRPTGGSRVWRAVALDDLIQKYGNRPYGFLNLVGFGIQSLLRLRNNPISCSDVCSQLDWIYLHCVDPVLVAGLRLRDCDPVKLFDLVSGAHP